MVRNVQIAWVKEAVMIETVGDLKKALAGFDDKVKVRAYVYHEQISSSGTDMGSEHEHKIKEVTDLEKRVLIHVDSVPSR